jgi:UPF0755 protein
MRSKRMVFLFIILFFVAGGIVFYTFYRRTYADITIPGGQDTYIFYVSTGLDMNDLIKNLHREGIVGDTAGFRWLAEKKNLESHLNPGRYMLRRGMDQNKLVNLIRSGKQEPVHLVFNSLRTIQQLAGVISKQIEADSLSILTLLTDEDFLSEYGWNSRTLPALFIPNTYQFYWNTSAKGFFIRMLKEYKLFWDGKRTRKAKALGLTPVEVSTLASIVDEETYKEDEMPKIAGVYLTRLEKRYKLQADPTVKFAKGDFGMTRVLKKDLQIDSPYNTYKYYGLPPGPIIIPSVMAIDAVLNPDRSGYLYFCAKEDFSGYHNFAKSLKEHNRNAKKYQNALNKRRIYK